MQWWHNLALVVFPRIRSRSLLLRFFCIFLSSPNGVPQDPFQVPSFASSLLLGQTTRETICLTAKGGCHGIGHYKDSMTTRTTKGYVRGVWVYVYVCTCVCVVYFDRHFISASSTISQITHWKVERRNKFRYFTISNIPDQGPHSNAWFWLVRLK